MANKNPSPKTRFQKGNKLGPGRNVKIPEELKAVKKLSKDEFQRAAAKCFDMTPREVLAKINDPTTTFRDLYFLRTLERFDEEKDPKVLEPIIARCIGKPVEEIELTQTKKLIAIRRFEGGAEYIGPEDQVKDYLQAKDVTPENEEK